MSEATRPVGNELVGGIVDLNRRLTLMETRYVRLAGNPVTLYDTTLTASAASIDFTGIQQNFTHLQLKYSMRGDAAGVDNIAALIRFNGDTGANYDAIYSLAIGLSGTVPVVNSIGATSALTSFVPASTAAANLFGSTAFEISDYAIGTKEKMLFTSYGLKVGTADGSKVRFGTSAGFWRSTAAITQITILPLSGNFVTGSRATLIGVP